LDWVIIVKPVLMDAVVASPLIALIACWTPSVPIVAGC
jgi:hypothetical protein